MNEFEMHLQILLNSKDEFAFFNPNHKFEVRSKPANKIPIDNSYYRICPGSIVSRMYSDMQVLKKENDSLKKDLLWCIENSGQLNFIREVKVDLLDKYFPDEKKRLAYYNGGIK